MARAMYERYCKAGELLHMGEKPIWETMDPLMKWHFEQYADAALDALLDPTEGMVNAMADCGGYDRGPRCPFAQSVFESGIRAAKDGK